MAVEAEYPEDRIIRLPRSMESPAIARQVIRERLSNHVADSAELLVGELVTNALVHTDGAIALRYSIGDARVRVEVSDESSATPYVVRSGPTADRGRGVALVDTLSDRWGSEPCHEPPAGKIVWFEIDR